MMALRLQPHIDDLVHPNQTGFLKGRFIGDNIRSIEDAIHFIETNLPDGLLLAIDFTKAFDSVRWDFIRLALEWFGFGPLFSDMVDLIFNQIETCVINAGNTSSYFKPKRGIRQGCCVSPYLFILVVEIMATHIRQNPDIQGLQLGNEEVKITQFADDSTCVLRSINSLPPLLKFLSIFASWSGLTINKTKSMILFPNQALSGVKGLHGIPVVGRVKILGIWFTKQNSTDDHYQLNFKPQLEKIKAVCNSWNARNLSIKGKITLVNSLMISLLQYQCSSIFTPPQVYKEYKKLVTDFIWSGRRSKVAYSTVILPVAHGGLNLMDLDTRIRVSTLQWVRRLIRNPSSITALFLKHRLNQSNLTQFFSFKLQQIPEGVRDAPFYRNLFDLWNKFHAFSPSEEDDIRREILWNNKFITSGGATVSIAPWEARGILSIDDICQPKEGRLCSHTEISRKYGVKCTFLDALSLRLSIPLAWRQALTPEWQKPPLPPSLSGIDILLPREQPQDIQMVSPKAMYKALILQPDTHPTAYKRWTDPSSYPTQILDPEEWKEANLSVYQATRETKLQSLHFKVMNRVIPCNAYLKQIRIKASDECGICGQVDSLVHFLFDCPSVHAFWTAICSWFGRVENLMLERLSSKQFVFGVPRSTAKAATINFIIMNAKFFILRQRLFHRGKLELLHWLREFKTKLLMERQICLNEGKSHRFKKWIRIFNAIG